MNKAREKIHIDAIIGQNICNARKSHKMSRRELAQAVGVSTSYVTQIEKGSRGTKVVHLSRISKVLGVTIDSLFVTPNAKGSPRIHTIQEHDEYYSTRENILNLLGHLRTPERDFIIERIKEMRKMLRTIHPRPHRF